LSVKNHEALAFSLKQKAVKGFKAFNRHKKCGSTRLGWAELKAKEVT